MPYAKVVIETRYEFVAKTAHKNRLLFGVGLGYTKGGYQSGFCWGTPSGGENSGWAVPVNTRIWCIWNYFQAFRAVTINSRNHPLLVFAVESEQWTRGAIYWAGWKTGAQEGVGKERKRRRVGHAHAIEIEKPHHSTDEMGRLYTDGSNTDAAANDSRRRMADSVATVKRECED